MREPDLRKAVQTQRSRRSAQRSAQNARRAADIIEAAEENLQRAVRAVEGLENAERKTYLQRRLGAIVFDLDELKSVAKAELSMDDQEAKAWAQRLIDQVRDIAENGLDEAYESDANAWATDFFAGDFPWDDDRRIVRAAFEGHPDFPALQKQVKEKIGIDIGAD